MYNVNIFLIFTTVRALSLQDSYQLYAQVIDMIGFKVAISLFFNVKVLVS